MFVFQSASSVDGTQKPSKFIWNELPTDNGMAKFDLTLLMKDAGEQIIATAGTTPIYLTSSRVKRILGHLEVLLTEVVADQDQGLATPPFLTGEQQQLLVEWNDTQPPLSAAPLTGTSCSKRRWHARPRRSRCSQLRSISQLSGTGPTREPISAASARRGIGAEAASGAVCGAVGGDGGGAAGGLESWGRLCAAGSAVSERAVELHAGGCWV